MPTKQTNLIVDNYASSSINTNVLVTEIFDKYSPCNSKYMAVSRSKAYIKNKLEKAIRNVKYDGQSAGNVASHNMIMGIWNALCPLKTNKSKDVPDMLYEDIEQILMFKSRDFLNAKKPKFGGKYSDSDNDNSESTDEQSSDNESDNDSEPEQQVVLKKKTNKTKQTKKNKQTQKTKTNKLTQKVKASKKDSESESESESESDSD